MLLVVDVVIEVVRVKWRLLLLVSDARGEMSANVVDGEEWNQQKKGPQTLARGRRTHLKPWCHMRVAHTHTNRHACLALPHPHVTLGRPFYQERTEEIDAR